MLVVAGVGIGRADHSVTVAACGAVARQSMRLNRRIPRTAHGRFAAAVECSPASLLPSGEIVRPAHTRPGRLPADAASIRWAACRQSNRPLVARRICGALLGRLAAYCSGCFRRSSRRNLLVASTRMPNRVRPRIAERTAVESSRCLLVSTPTAAISLSVSVRKRTCIQPQHQDLAAVVPEGTLTEIGVRFAADVERIVPGDVQSNGLGRLLVGQVMQLLQNQSAQRHMKIFARPTEIILKTGRQFFDR